MTIAVPMLERGNSNSIVRSPKNLCLNTATAPATAVVKSEDVSAVMEAAESSNPSPNAVATQEAVLQAIKWFVASTQIIFEI